ncbi:MAG: hypothetical protein COW10_07500, partial [Candidatus Omnitrophica bacterium CG12_big_fil_rev_8_21_14_0_65_42_8]
YLNGNVGIGTTGPGSNLHIAGSTGVTIGEDKTAGTVNTAGTMKLFSAGDNAYYTTITAGTQTANADYTLPTALPASNGQALTSTTTGVLSWANSGVNDAAYITQTPNSILSAEQALSALATGLLKNTTTTGVLSIATPGTDYYNPGGTDIAVLDGGTGASDAATARTNLGLAIGTNVQAYDADLDDLADGSLTGSKVGTGISATNVTTGTLPNTVLDLDLQDLADGSLSGSLVGTGINATNITTGTLGTGLYSAYSDLSAEGYLGDNADTDLTSKLYVDNAIAGLKWKGSVRVATTIAGTLATSFANAQSVDGIALATNDRILIKNQVTGSENGIYTVNASGAPTRSTDADASSEILQTAVFIEEGSTNADTAWVCNTNAPIALNTTALSFTQFTGAAAYVWGDGLSNSGNTVNVGAGTGIDVDANTVIHEDLSTQASVDNSNGSVIQDVTMDTLGHVTGLASIDLDTRYFTETEANTNYVNVSGDTMTGTLTFSNVATDITTGTNEHLALMPNGAGNVGIGTTNPASKLEVNGDISVPAGNKINVEGSSGDSYMAYDSSTNKLNVYVNGEVVAYFKN